METKKGMYASVLSPPPCAINGSSHLFAFISADYWFFFRDLTRFGDGP